MKAFGIFVSIFLGTLLIVAVIAGVTFGIRWVTASPKGKLAAREEILSGPSRIALSNKFFNMCGSVQGIEGTLDNLFVELKNAPADDRQRVQINITANQALRSQAIAEYNADATNTYTVGQFRSVRLPYQLASNIYTGENKTLCAA